MTAFGNYAMPLIRYDVGDVARLSERTTCKCGRGGTLIEQIDGRVEDYIVTPDGRFVGRLDHLFKDSVNVVMSQIEQHDTDAVHIRIVKDTGYTEKDEAIIREEARERLGNKIGIYFDYPDDIPLTREGKFRFVTSKVAKSALSNAG